MKVDYSLVSFVQRATRRKRVLECLDTPKTPKNVSTELNLSISNVSNSLAELKDKELVECLNPDDHLAKYYQQTAKGKEVLSMAKSVSS